MISAIDSCEKEVITVAVGKAMSCGAILLSHGDTRFATSNSRIMIHEISQGLPESNVNDLKNDTAETTRLNKYWQKIIADNCGYSQKQWSSLFTNQKRDIYLSATEAKSFGIVDKIGFPKIIEEVSYKLVY